MYAIRSYYERFNDEPGFVDFCQDRSDEISFNSTGFNDCKGLFSTHNFKLFDVVMYKGEIKKLLFQFRLGWQYFYICISLKCCIIETV